jgi:hypothetical protein
MGSGILQDAVFITHRELHKVLALQSEVVQYSLYSFLCALWGMVLFLEAIVSFSGLWFFTVLIFAAVMEVLAIIFRRKWNKGHTQLLDEIKFIRLRQQ